MKLEFTRNEIIKIASFLKFFSLTEDERITHLENALAEKGLDLVVPAKGNEILRKYIEAKFSEYKNDYLQEFVSNSMNQTCLVVGKDILLNTCPCCCYRTLRKRNEYFICAVCFWEDDGTVHQGDYSSVNRMTLREAFSNFNEYGTISAVSTGYVDEERRKRYLLDNSCVRSKRE